MNCDNCSDHGGYCEPHDMHKSPYRVFLCKTKKHYKTAWDEGRGPGQRAGPGPKRRKTLEEKIQKVCEFNASLRLGASSLAVVPSVRSEEEALEKLEQCKACRCFAHDFCTKDAGCDKKVVFLTRLVSRNCREWK